MSNDLTLVREKSADACELFEYIRSLRFSRATAPHTVFTTHLINALFLYIRSNSGEDAKIKLRNNWWTILRFVCVNRRPAR